MVWPGGGVVWPGGRGLTRWMWSGQVGVWSGQLGLARWVWSGQVGVWSGQLGLARWGVVWPGGVWSGQVSFLPHLPHQPFSSRPAADGGWRLSHNCSVDHTPTLTLQATPCPLPSLLTPQGSISGSDTPGWSTRECTGEHLA